MRALWVGSCGSGVAAACLWIGVDPDHPRIDHDGKKLRIGDTAHGPIAAAGNAPAQGMRR